MFTAVTAGTFLGMTIANASATVPFEVNDTGTSNDVSSEVHGLSGDDRISFHPTRSETLPTGIVEGTIYFVLTAGITANTFNVSATSGGAELDITSDGKGVYQIGTPENFGGQGQYSVTDFDGSLLA
jgi:hypothetical protein